jgi:SAM-dependent methyltransferase
MLEQKLHIGCGPEVIEGWMNIDKSPSVFLSRAPRIRSLLFRLRLLTSEQAQGFPPGAYHADVTKRIPVDDSSVSLIYTSHMIEHLSRWACVNFVRECRRVLRPGGILRIATPDLEQLVREYLEQTSPILGQNPTAADAFCQAYGAYSDPVGGPIKVLVRKLVGGDSHQWLYDGESLAYLLREGGFQEIDRFGFQEGRFPGLAQVETRPRSLFMEAT